MKLKLLNAIILLSLMMSILSSCKAGTYGEDFTNVKWVSEDPPIEFTVLNEKDCGFGTITFNDQKIDVFCQWFLNKKLVIYRVDDYADDFDFYNDALGGTGIMSFSYKIKGNQAILKVITDELFDFRYETITIVCEKIE